MRKAIPLAMCFFALLTSHRAESANAAPAKGALTAAEREQCRAQLTVINSSARAHNAKLEEIKALEAEIDALRAELDKEQAAVNRRDSAAMQALNAKISRNNELVAQHEQMSAAISAMAADHKQRDAEFREACENRPPAPPPLPSQPAAPQTPQTSHARSSDTACSSTTSSKDVQRKIEATFAQMRADEKQHQSELERVAQARAAAQSWTKEKQSKIWLELIASPKFMALEREKQPHVQELFRVIGTKPKNVQDECRLVQRIAAILPAIKAINARQYAFMKDALQAAK